MDFNRINPVILVAGAASGQGAAYARDLARRAAGGLILIDGEAGALDAAAEALPAAPERVSTLAFDIADRERWRQASAFIAAQYGRLDFAAVSVGDSAQVLTDRQIRLRERGADADLDAAFLSLRALIPLMRANAQGGAFVLTASSAAIADTPDHGLSPLLRIMAAEGAAANVRVNAIAIGPAHAAAARRAPAFADLAREAGDDSRAIVRVAGLPAAIARCERDEVERLLALLLNAPVTGVTLVAETKTADIKSVSP